MEPSHGLHENQCGLRPLLCRTFSERFRGVPGHPFEPGFDLTLGPERLAQPLKWKRPQDGFCQLDERPFPQDVPHAYVLCSTRWSAPTGTRIQVLTKRRSPEHAFFMLAIARAGTPTSGGGCLSRTAQSRSRIDHLRKATAASAFLRSSRCSVRREHDLAGIHWAIVGGESGRARGRCDQMGGSNSRSMPAAARRSFSSNGEDVHRRPQAVCLRVRSGANSPRRP